MRIATFLLLSAAALASCSTPREAPQPPLVDGHEQPVVAPALRKRSVHMLQQLTFAIARRSCQASRL